MICGLAADSWRDYRLIAASFGVDVTVLTDFSYDEIIQIITPLEECGSGSFASVYKGNWDAKEVAVKKYEAEHADLAETERQAYSDLGCYSNIVEPLGFCWSTHFYIVMNYVPYTLQQVIEVSNFNWHETLHVLTQVAYAIRALGEEKYIFADIKPDNLLIAKDFSVFLCDFGSAKKTGEYLPAANHSHAAAELFSSSTGNKVSNKVDIYSFGVILLQMVMDCSKAGTIDYSTTALKKVKIIDKKLTGKKKRKEKNASNEEGKSYHIVITAARQMREDKHVVNKKFIGCGCNDEDAWEVSDLAAACTSDKAENRSAIDDVIRKMESRKMKEAVRKLKISVLDWIYC
ncbi:PREDICTED: proline-rich receptor-like protein kinase PERK8 [Erythranthe guttata]|uniref:proline-rich receptor-like protein kinase PERK8 n=1 Tax=Erythranthe guttata TaxID=4155 RepID=UPI00064DBC0A|nr:PREDICTED: proline-rich receptor-like protein kinase PERK8 [Erythranthe guttata]|eukprot:XP_012831625.1 PREDICTED: proline-rich receptor-like protein kinase PERK8 [Erythranthe guttata]